MASASAENVEEKPVAIAAELVFVRKERRFIQERLGLGG
jgi:hypothetical protein